MRYGKATVLMCRHGVTGKSDSDVYPLYEKIQIVDLCMYFNSIYDTTYIL